MIVSLGLGISLTWTTSHTVDPSAVAKSLAVVSYACFVATFFAYLLGWLLLGHELWKKDE